MPDYQVDRTYTLEAALAVGRRPARPAGPLLGLGGGRPPGSGPPAQPARSAASAAEPANWL